MVLAVVIMVNTQIINRYVTKIRLYNSCNFVLVRDTFSIHERASDVCAPVIFTLDDSLVLDTTAVAVLIKLQGSGGGNLKYQPYAPLKCIPQNICPTRVFAVTARCQKVLAVI